MILINNDHSSANTVRMVKGPDTKKGNEAASTKSEITKKKSKEEKQPTKVVIRRLPGSMTQETFMEQISPLFQNDYFYYVQGENQMLGECNFSRAYINFVNVEDVFTFTQKFDDYVFIDNTGHEYPAIVEFAPFQRIPKNKANRKIDELCGTIEDDPDYKEFVEQMEAQEHDQKSNPITEHYFDLTNDENEVKITTTPLIEYLTCKKNDWLKQKEEKKEERRRRDLERKKMKEEQRRIKKEAKEAHKLQAVVERLKLKEEKKKDQDNATEDIKVISSSRSKGKSYQEERQRDLARRKQDDKPLGSGDMKEIKAPVDKNSNKESDVTTEDTKPDHGDRKDDFKKKTEEKKFYREDDRRYSHSKEKEDKRAYYGHKKRDYGNGYDYDAKYKNSKRDSHYYEDYKTRSHSSYQKPSYSGKYGSSKNKEFDDRGSKRFENKKKYDDHKDSKKNSVSERESRSSENKDDGKSSVEPKSSKKDFVKYEEEKPCTSSDKYSDFEPKSRDEKADDRKDDRVERRIKNKDRPTMEIYRPGMGKFSRQRLEHKKSDEGKEGDQKN